LVATNSEGGAALIFDVVDGGNQVYGSLRSGAGWSTPVRLNEEGKTVVAESARVAIGPDGVLHATWIDATNGKLIFGSLAPGGSPTRITLQEVAGGGITAEPPAAPKIAEDDRGRIAVIWVQEAAGVRTVKAKVREPGSSTFSAALDVSPLTNQPRTDPWIAIDPSGRLVAAYTNVPSIGHSDALGATLEPGAAQFTEPVQLGENSHVTSPSGIATDADGNTLVAIYKSDGTTEARVAPFDAAGPVFDALSIPSAGTAGSPLSFTASTVDAWSGLGSVSWAFGDGSSALGGSVAHTFSSPGTRSVKVTASDQLGNSSEASGSTVVGGPPGPELSNLKLSRKRFRVAGATKASRARSSRKRRKVPMGTKVSFRLSEAASVRLAIRPRRMKRRGAIPRGFTDRGILQRSAKAGANAFRFNGKLGGRRLIADQYRLEVTATDPDGNRSKPQSVTFTIVGR
jgi:hypothetical protein